MATNPAGGTAYGDLTGTRQFLNLSTTLGVQIDGLEALGTSIVAQTVAQATAVMMGQEEEETDKDKNNMGYIVGIKGAGWTDPYLPVGTRLAVKTEKKQWKDNYGLFTGWVYHDQTLCGEVDVQVFRPDEVL